MEPTTLDDLLPHLVALIIKTKRNKQTKRKEQKKRTYIYNTQKTVLFYTYKDHKIFKQQKTENKPKKKQHTHKHAHSHTHTDTRIHELGKNQKKGTFNKNAKK